MTEAEIDRAWKLLNTQTDTLLKLTQLQTEPWKLVAAGMGGGAALLGAAVGLAALLMRHG